jgi:hypothetical protein
VRLTSRNLRGPGRARVLVGLESSACTRHRAKSAALLRRKGGPRASPRPASPAGPKAPVDEIHPARWGWSPSSPRSTNLNQPPLVGVAPLRSIDRCGRRCGREATGERRNAISAVTLVAEEVAKAGGHDDGMCIAAGSCFWLKRPAAFVVATFAKQRTIDLRRARSPSHGMDGSKLALTLSHRRMSASACVSHQWAALYSSGVEAEAICMRRARAHTKVLVALNVSHMYKVLNIDEKN